MYIELPHLVFRRSLVNIPATA